MKKQFSNKKILLTGGAGYLGSILTGELLKKGYEVRVLDCLMFGRESLLAFNSFSKFQLIKGDIRDEKVVNKTLDDVFCVFHLAALVGEPACKVNPEKTFEINLSGTKKLIELAKKNNVKKFIFSSTCSNYGVTDFEDEADETYPLNPLSLYAQTKIKAENAVISSKSDKFTPTVLRFGTLFGISPKMRFNLLVNEIVKDAYFGKKIIISKPQAWRPYLHVKDAANSLISILEASEKLVSGEIFNVVGENKQKIDIIKLVKKYFPKIKVKFIEDSRADQRDYKVNGDKIKKNLRIRKNKSIEEGIIEIKKAIEEHVFENPNDKKYSIWLNEKLL